MTDDRQPAPVVLFDFDGTLASREGGWRGALLTALDQLGVQHSVTLESLRLGLRDGFPWHAPSSPHLHLDTSESWWAELRALFRRAYVAAGISEQVAERAADGVRFVYLDERYWTVFDDVPPALHRLRVARYRTVILSNHVPELADLGYRLGLGDLIDVVLTSAVIGYEKPHPAAFGHAVELVGRPETVWMVGDNPVADVEGAVNAGISALLVRTPDASGRVVGLLEAVDLITTVNQRDWPSERHHRRGHGE